MSEKEVRSYAEQMRDLEAQLRSVLSELLDIPQTELKDFGASSLSLAYRKLSNIIKVAPNRIELLRLSRSINELTSIIKKITTLQLFGKRSQRELLSINVEKEDAFCAMQLSLEGMLAVFAAYERTQVFTPNR